jgi:ubiquinone/menaquinone biosynthesis C-methylase UbiE
MDRLSGAAELLDGPFDDPTALVANLRDLTRINRLTGGAALSVRAVAGLGGAATILDVGTGAADIPLTLLARAGSAGRALAVTATDSRREVLDAARRAQPAIDRTRGLELALADGRRLPYPDGSFDIAHASLVLHHLEPADAVAFLGELRRVARNGIVVNDLVRGRWFWLGGWLLVHAIGTSRYTRHDGPLSVRRAYSQAELAGLLAAAGLATVATFRGFAGHRLAIAAR